MVLELDEMLLTEEQYELRQFKEAHMVLEHGKDVSPEQATKMLGTPKRMRGQVEQISRNLIQITVRPGGNKTARAWLRVQGHKHGAKVPKP